MSRVSITYTYTYQVDFATEYKFTNCGKCVNTKTQRELNKRYVSGCIGYSIRSKFYSLTYLRKHLEKEVIVECPF